MCLRFFVSSFCLSCLLVLYHFLPTHYRCRRLLLQLFTLNDTGTPLDEESVRRKSHWVILEHPWTRNRPFACYTNISTSLAEESVRRRLHWVILRKPWTRNRLFAGHTVARTCLDEESVCRKSHWITRGHYWMKDRPVAGTCTWQHTTLPTDRYPHSSGIQTHSSSKRAATNPRLRPRGHGIGYGSFKEGTFLRTCKILKNVCRILWLAFLEEKTWLAWAHTERYWNGYSSI